MKKKIFLAAGAFVAVSLTAITMWHVKESQNVLSAIALANIEALSSPEKPDCSYNRNEGQCTISVEAKGSIKLFNGTILKADAEGNISFDGKVVCSAGGSYSCTPVECVNLYTVILTDK